LINRVQGWAWTEYDGGRRKLPGRKRGTRRWKCWFICTCKHGKHTTIPKDFHFSISKKGELRTTPSFCTHCPLNCIELKSRLPVDGEWRLFSKWTETAQRWNSNHGDVAQLAIDWLRAQGVGTTTTFCSNGGRYALAGWLSKTYCPYHESHEVHGDTPDVWGKYQPSMPATNFTRRTQSPVADIACAALRRVVKFFGRGRTAHVSHIVQGDLAATLMVRYMESQGRADLVQETCGRFAMEQMEQKTEH